ncbi:MAG TPA: AsmA-like C-terminal region-containing protein [Microvirga sp.]|nr:AsmA-like C-terminal region-containing protein [Microvirga sp.]
MRDILTVIAAFVILILLAALVAPPLVDWEAQRAVIDNAISRATGTEARTEGRIGVRLLPSPRVRFDRLRLGPQSPGAPSLAADFVWSEIALTPLLRGEVLFLDTRIGRADLRVPVSPDGSWRLPAALVAGAGRDPGLAIENLVVAQLLVTMQVPETGRTDQFYAEGVTLDGQKLAGPWRVEGTARGVPFRLVTGELGEDRTLALKLIGGGDTAPRFEVDGRLALEQKPDGSTSPNLSGRAKVLLGPPAQAGPSVPVPVSLDAGFKTAGSAVELDPVTLEVGEGGSSLRLSGSGSVRLAEPRVALKLDGRRLDADSLLASAGWKDLVSGLRAGAPALSAVPVDLDLALASVGIAQEEITNLVLRASLDPARLAVERLSFAAPGDTRVRLSGEFGLASDGGLSGRVAVTSAASNRAARLIERLGLRNPFLTVLDGRPFDGAADITVAPPVTSFRNVRVKAGDATLTGNARYTAPEPGARGRLDAQVAVQGLDLDQLPRVSSIFDATQNLDVGFMLDARDVRAGSRRGAGRISARIASDGPTLVVETLDVSDLAGANARASGRIAADGSGRIAGKVTAPRAAPLVDLLGSVWVGGVAKLVPPFLREGALDLDVVTERAPPQPGAPELRLRTTARGRAAGGGFEGELLTVDGLTHRLDLKLTTDDTGRWVDRPDLAAMRRPSEVAVSGTRVGSGRFTVTGSGDIAGVRVTVAQPFALSAEDDVVDSGAADIAGGDVTPFLALFGRGAAAPGPVPVQVRATLAREGGAPLLAVVGRIADQSVQARLAVRSLSEVSGSVIVDRLSLPWLLSAVAFNAPVESGPTATWPASRFGDGPRPLTGGQTTLRVRRLDLGRGLAADNAVFTLAANPDGVAIRDLEAGLGGGRLTGLLAVTRQGALASVVAEGAWRDVPLGVLAGPAPLQARLSGTLKAGASGETLAGLIANLGGSGEARLADLRAPGADPQAVGRALRRLLAEEDPLAARRTETVVAEELARAPLAASSVSSAVSVVGGVVRLSPVAIEAPAASWQGAIAYDLKSLTLDARGTLVSKETPPRNWSGGAPAVGLAWRGPLGAPAREIDAAPLANGLASIVLQRELEKIEMFEADANELRRRQQRRDMDRQRERDRIAAEEAARLARLREEAEQRVRAEAERRAMERAQERAAQERAARERAAQERAAQERAAQEAGSLDRVPPPIAPAGASILPPLPPPIDIRPPPQIGVRPGG